MGHKCSAMLWPTRRFTRKLGALCQNGHRGRTSRKSTQWCKRRWTRPGCAQELDAVAYTLGPGLQGSLHVGTSFAKAFAWALGVPSIPVHHMRAHVLAHVLEPEPSPACPFLCLTVSGGHTQLVKVNAPGDMEVLGQTLDDAAGEAFDKVAKLMGLPYPGGPVVDRLAQQGSRGLCLFTPTHGRVHRASAD